jgi:hypothetical protein
MFTARRQTNFIKAFKQMISYGHEGIHLPINAIATAPGNSG